MSWRHAGSYIITIAKDVDTLDTDYTDRSQCIYSADSQF